MKITISKEELENAMTLVTNVINDKKLNDELKNLIVWIKNGKMKFVANSYNIVSLLDINAEFEGVESDDTFLQLRARDINNVLATFKSLSRTSVSKIIFDISDTNAIMYVHEEPIDIDDENASKYRQVSKFKVATPRLQPIIVQQIRALELGVEYKTYKSADICLYLDSLLPTIAKETREISRDIIFSEEHIYTTATGYTAIMVNNLGEDFSGFRVINTICAFVRNFINDTEEFEFNKRVDDKGIIHLTLRKAGVVAVLRCADLTRAFDISNFVSIPPNGVEVDKYYLADVLKRVNLSSEAIQVDIVIENGLGSMTVTSANMKQELPVFRAKGEGSYSFSIKAELLSNMVFTHATTINSLIDKVFLYFENSSNNIVMACKDNSKLWNTKMLGLVSSKTNFAWK